MTPTEELRRLLDERGVEYEVDDAKTVRVTRWGAYGDWVSFIEYDNGDTKFCIDARRLTPEQAVEATLGRSECRFRTVERFIDARRSRADMCECDRCGYRCARGFIQDERFKYCPNCGRKVVSE